MTALEPVPGQLCGVCGLPDPDHDWDVHDAAAPPATRGFGAALPNMLTRSSTRGGKAVRVLAVHTTEGILRAADLRAWASWTGSSHASADADGALLGPAEGFVPYHLAAWTLRSGNPWSENIELCGLASWTRPQWLARPLLLEGCARWLAERSTARGIPLVKLTAAQYRAGASGVIDHHDHTVGYQDGTHWDVGTSFPWDVVLPRAQALAAPTTTEEEDDMPQYVTATAGPGQQITQPLPPVLGGAVGNGPAWLTVLGDCHDKPRQTIKARVGILGATGYRPAFGTDYVTALTPGTPAAAVLREGDRGLVLAAYDYPVGAVIEYGKR